MRGAAPTEEERLGRLRAGLLGSALLCRREGHCDGLGTRVLVQLLN